MFSLPRDTHRFLIEPISGCFHLKKILLCRFLSFLNQARNSGKIVPKELLKVIQYDTKSVTGNNIRNILRLTGKIEIQDVKKQDIFNIEYFAVPEGEKWRIDLIKEIIEIQNSVYEVHDFSTDQMNDMLVYACSS